MLKVLFWTAVIGAVATIVIRNNMLSSVYDSAKDVIDKNISKFAKTAKSEYQKV